MGTFVKIPESVMVLPDDIIRIRAPLPFAEPDHVNCYVIAADGERLLVDTGMLGSQDTIDAALVSGGLELDGVVLTHGHPDHWGIARRYTDVVRGHADIRAQLTFGSRDHSEIDGLPPGWSVNAELFEVLRGYERFTLGVPELEEISDGEMLGEWEVILTPGHAPGHVCLYRARDRVLIAGDHLLPEITPNIHLTDGMPDAVADYLASLRRVAAMDIALVLPSHGDPFRDAAGRAAALIAHHERRLARLEEVLRADGPAGVGQLSRRLFRVIPDDPVERLMAEMETYAHLEYLRLRDRVALGEDVWRLAA